MKYGICAAILLLGNFGTAIASEDVPMANLMKDGFEIVGTVQDRGKAALILSKGAELYNCEFEINQILQVDNLISCWKYNTGD